ncbi:MAG: methyltransferase [Flavobacteriaceae bacterium]|nr:methyltransferase [Flavobacteriaceae bacterium]
MIFKQFTINHDRCAMKIGTDGVLLGAWATIKHNPTSILDIGTGTGIIALQLAQRSDAELIDAVEIEDNAYEQAVENFENSPWGDRLFCYHTSLEEFANEIDETYDLIVSNPPFYSEDFLSNNKARNMARFTTSLPFDMLLKNASALLTENGVFTTIIPYKEEEGFIQSAENYNLFINKICRVKGTPTTEIKRSLLEFSFRKNTIETTELIIENQRHNYTEDYINLVKDFYLKM